MNEAPYDITTYVKLFEQGDSTADERKHILLRERIAAQVAKMQCTDQLNAKILRYEKDIIPAEKELAIPLTLNKTQGSQHNGKMQRTLCYV